MNKLILISTVALLTGCAASPKSIQPLAYSGTGLSCDLGEMNLRLSKLSKAQSQARTGDIIGIALIGIPVGGKGHEKEIAVLKGQIIQCGGTV